MTFNVENGGTQVGIHKVMEAIRKANADIVGLQEPWGNTAWLAKELEFPYWSARQHIMSRFPLFEPAACDGAYAFAEITPGQVVAIANVHLPSDRYGPDALRDGVSFDVVVKIEQKVRLAKAKPIIRTLEALGKRGMPVFMLGDFNCPSHLDWTRCADTTSTHPHAPWLVSRYAEQHMLKDSYRHVHPSAVKSPGCTWPAMRPSVAHHAHDGWDPKPDDSVDRIDFILYGGTAIPVTSEIVGEPEHASASLGVAPWPSDHRAVVSSFQVTPAPPPPFIAVQHPVVRVGEAVHFAHAGDPEAHTGEKPLSQSGIAHNVLRTQDLTPGAYMLTLQDRMGRHIDRTTLHVIDTKAKPVLLLQHTTIPKHATITIGWENTPGNRFDFISLEPAVTNPVRFAQPMRFYTNAAIAGTMTLTLDNAKTSDWMPWNASKDGIWPLPPGKYVLTLGCDDSTTVLDTCAFDVVP